MRLTHLIVPVMLTASMLVQPCYGVDDIDVTVDGSSSLADPIGVGYGHWERAEPLLIKVSAAAPRQLASATVYLPEEVIWNPTHTSLPEPWFFETCAIAPDEAFAVVLHGTLKPPGGGGGGVGTPPDWAIALSDIDIDCDSDNDSEQSDRSPEVGSDGEDEDLVEFPDESSSSDPGGMVMSSSAVWANLRVTGHFKRDGLVTLELSGDTLSFEIADDQYNVLGQVENPTYIPEPGAIVLYEKRIDDAQTYPETFYIRPSGSGQDEDQVTATVFFTGAPAPASKPVSRPSGKTATDRTVTTQKTWVITPEKKLTLVMVDADENYSAPGADDPPYNKAIPKKVVVRGPGPEFKLKRDWTAGNEAKILVYEDKECTQQKLVTFHATTKKSDVITMPGNGAKPFWVKGKSPDQGDEPKDVASSSMNDQKLELLVGEQSVKTTTWTAVWVPLSISSAGAVPDDNRCKVTYKAMFGTDQLGPYGNDPKDGNVVGITLNLMITGTVHPSNLEAHYFSLRRELKGMRSYWGIVSGLLVEAEWNEADTSLPPFLDENQKSGQSVNKIYDIDSPGFNGTNKEPQSLLPGLPTNAIVAYRANFWEWAELYEERCSKSFKCFVRRAAKKGVNNKWTNNNLLNPDNTAGQDWKDLGYNAPLGFHVSLKPQSGYVLPDQQGNSVFQFTATTGGGTKPFRAAWRWTGAGPYGAWSEWVDADPATWNKNHTYALGGGTGEHVAYVKAEDKANPAKSDWGTCTVYQNRPPNVSVSAKFAANNTKLVVEGTVTDPEGDGIKKVKWSIWFLDAQGAPIGNKRVRENKPAKGFTEENVPENAASALVRLWLEDKHGASSGDAWHETRPE